MSSKAWYESWFDSPLYEKLYAARDDREAARLVNWIAGMFPPHQYLRALDIGCGRGRHSLMLAGHGYHVTGVDLSTRAISKARRKADAARLENLTFRVGDMRTFRNGPFQLVCNLFTSFGYFDDDADNLSVMRNMAANLAPGGVLVMDFLNPRFTVDNLVPREQTGIGELACDISRSIEGDMVVKTIAFSGEHGHEEQRYQERVKLYGPEWFMERFRELKLEDIRFYGGYQGQEFDERSSQRQLMVARRPE
ncbi:class I SAM-dependent methyltransferase [Balneolales bacterium ANBcel1]|nr:class I SAM-dependent methyltransferase [Balneolales bacterium ANBcel1]